MSEKYPCWCTDKVVDVHCVCSVCRVTHCSSRELHERVAASVGVKEYNELRQILTDHGIKLPASWGRTEEEDAFLRSVAVALVKLENEVHGADVEHPPTPAWPEEPPEDPVDNTFFDHYPSPPAPPLTNKCADCGRKFSTKQPQGTICLHCDEVRSIG